METSQAHNVNERVIATERNNRIKGPLQFDVLIRDDVSVRLQDKHLNTFFLLDQNVQISRIGTRAIIIYHDIIDDHYNHVKIVIRQMCTTYYRNVVIILISI